MSAAGRCGPADASDVDVRGLPLAPFEHYMLADHRPDYPMTLWVRLGLSGAVEVERLREALARTLQRNPLATSRVTECFLRGPAWQTAPQIPEITCVDATDGDELDERDFDVTREPGLRLRLAQKTDGAFLWLQFHHVCTDGIGALEFARQLLCEYTRTQSDSDSRPDDQLPRLDERHTTGIGRWGMACRAAKDFRRIRDYLIRAPISLGHARLQGSKSLPVAHRTPSQTPVVDFCSTEAQLTQLKKETRERGVTINDWLLASLFRTLAQWNQIQPGRRGGRWYRIAVPLNMRGADEGVGCFNKVSMVFLDRRQRDMEDPEGLLAGIHREMQYIREHRLGIAMWRVLGLLNVIPGGMRNFLRFDTCATTAILSNWGEAFSDGAPLCRTQPVQAGSSTLERVDVYAPVRRRTPAAFTACTYAGRLSLHLRYAFPDLGEASAASLHALFVRNALPGSEAIESRGAPGGAAIDQSAATQVFAPQLA